MSWQALVVGGIVVAAVAFLAGRLYRTMFRRGARGCGCGCGVQESAQPRVVRKQIIPVDQLTPDANRNVDRERS